MGMPLLIRREDGREEPAKRKKSVQSRKGVMEIHERERFTSGSGQHWKNAEKIVRRNEV